jgi:hypothetical protein
MGTIAHQTDRLIRFRCLSCGYQWRAENRGGEDRTVLHFGTPNPLAGDVTRIYTAVLSQPGRMLNDFRHLGFNQAENGRIVFDGMMQWIAAGDGLNKV